MIDAGYPERDTGMLAVLLTILQLTFPSCGNPWHANYHEAVEAASPRLTPP